MPRLELHSFGDDCGNPPNGGSVNIITILIIVLLVLLILGFFGRGRFGR